MFNEPTRSCKIQHRYWTLGSNSILETEDYTHLGINSNKYSNQPSSIESSSRKLRSTLMSLVIPHAMDLYLILLDFFGNIHLKCIYLILCKLVFSHINIHGKR